MQAKAVRCFTLHESGGTVLRHMRLAATWQRACFEASEH